MFKQLRIENAVNIDGFLEELSMHVSVVTTFLWQKNIGQYLSPFPKKIVDKWCPLGGRFKDTVATTKRWRKITVKTAPKKTPIKSRLMSDY